MSDKERTCPSCGTAYPEHLGLIGTCKELQEALEAFSVVSRTSNEYLCQLTAAEMSVKDYRAKNTMLREALKKIASGETDCCYEPLCSDVAKKAISGGGE